MECLEVEIWIIINLNMARLKNIQPPGEILQQILDPLRITASGCRKISYSANAGFADS